MPQPLLRKGLFGVDLSRLYRFRSLFLEQHKSAGHPCLHGPSVDEYLSAHLSRCADLDCTTVVQEEAAHAPYAEAQSLRAATPPAALRTVPDSLSPPSCRGVEVPVSRALARTDDAEVAQADNSRLQQPSTAILPISEAAGNEALPAESGKEGQASVAKDWRQKEESDPAADRPAEPETSPQAALPTAPEKPLRADRWTESSELDWLNSDDPVTAIPTATSVEMSGVCGESGPQSPGRVEGLLLSKSEEYLKAAIFLIRGSEIKARWWYLQALLQSNKMMTAQPMLWHRAIRLPRSSSSAATPIPLLLAGGRQ